LNDTTARRVRITTVALDDLKLAVGKEAYAVVDATDVMVGID
jgi:molybdopterin-binding protein